MNERIKELYPTGHPLYHPQDRRIKELGELAWTMVSDEEHERGEPYEDHIRRERRDQFFCDLIADECREAIVEHSADTYNEGIQEAITILEQQFGID